MLLVHRQRAPMSAATRTASPFVGELNRRRRELDDVPTMPFESCLAIATSAIALRRQWRARRRIPRLGLRRVAADFANAQVHVAGDRGDDGQAVERDAVEAAAIDLPRQQRFPAGRRRFAVHDAAAGEHFRRSRLDVRARDRGRRGRRATTRHQAGQRRCRNCSSWSSVFVAIRRGRCPAPYRPQQQRAAAADVGSDRLAVRTEASLRLPAPVRGASHMNHRTSLRPDPPQP